MGTVLSIVFALCAAAMFGWSSILQHDAARTVRGAKLLRVDLLWQLLQRPRWRVGFGLSALSFGVQAIALGFGPLALVQPIASTDLLFAMPLIAAGGNHRLQASDWLGVSLLAGGVAAFLALTPPSVGRAAPSTTDWLPVLVGFPAMVLVLVPASLRARPPVRTALLAGIAAAAFAVLDALTKSIAGIVVHDGAATLLHWETYALGSAAIFGLFFSQSAFRSGNVLISLPIIDSVEPIGAVLIGTTVFAEHIARSPALLTCQLLAGASAVTGIAVVNRSPLMRSLQDASSDAD